MSNNDMIKIEEVAVLVGCNVQTLNYYYRFKRENPDNKYAKILPDYVQIGRRGTRYWHRDAIKNIIDFRNRIPKGRGGALGSVTQRRHIQAIDDSQFTMNLPEDYIHEIHKIMKNHDVEEETIKTIFDMLVSEYEWRTGEPFYRKV